MLNFTVGDSITLSNLEMASPFLVHIFVVNGQSSVDAAQGTLMSVTESTFVRIASSVFAWDTRSDSAGDYFWRLNVTDSQFATTKLILGLNSRTENEETQLRFKKNQFCNDTDGSRNPVSSGFLLNLQYHRLLASALTFSDNVCEDDACIATTDCALRMTASTFSTNEAPSFIWQSSQTQSSVDAIEATQLCIDSLTVTNDASDAFLSIVDYTAADWLFVNDSSVGSDNLVSFVSMSGSVQSEMVNACIYQLTATTIGEAVFLFTAQTDIADAVNVEITNSVFRTTGAVSTISDVDTQFSDNGDIFSIVEDCVGCAH